MWKGEIMKELESVGTTSFGLKGPALKGYTEIVDRGRL